MQSELLGPSIQLAIVVLALSIIIAGARGPKFIFSSIGALISAPFKSGLVTFALAVLVAWHYFGKSFAPVVKWLNLIPKQGQATAQSGILLSGYPLLSQLDHGIYRPAGFSETRDESMGQPVAKLACLATVYAMLERGRGREGFITPESYRVADGAINPGYVENAPGVEFNADGVLTELRAGRPVVLHGRGGPLGNHFVLAVGVKPGAGDVILANDPWSGKQIELRPDSGFPAHPTMRGLVFDRMRRIR